MDFSPNGTRFDSPVHPPSSYRKVLELFFDNQSREVLVRRKLMCADEGGIRRFFTELGAFDAVIEATASYEWFVRLIEPVARRVLLAHPKKSCSRDRGSTGRS